MTPLGRAWITTAIACIVALVVIQTAPAAPSGADAPEATQVAFWSGAAEYDFSFGGVFPKPVYQKSYFTWLMLGASIVVAGTIVYFTAGAGAPAAATGVSTVASTIAGGGAGSYMAGLSIIGGWFGGNAMLGSAILNGIALGLGGGGAAYGSLTAFGKVGVMASVTATALDGVLVYMPPDAKELVYRVRLPIPDRIGSDNVQDLVEELHDIDAELVKLSNRIEEVRPEGSSEERKPSEPKSCQFVKAALATLEKLDTEINETAQWELQAEICGLVDKRDAAVKKAEKQASTALNTNTNGEDLLVLAILSKNAGDEETYSKLLRRIQPETVTNRSYLDYLNAVSRIEQGDLMGSRELLKRSWGASPYAVEPALLLVNVLGHKGILRNEREILRVVQRAEETFDSDDYASSYSLLALYFRTGAMYFLAGRYSDAQKYYEKAYGELPWTQKYFGSTQIRGLILLGIANSLYGQNKRKSAQEMFDKLLEDAESEDEREFLRRQYVPTRSTTDA